MQAQDTPGTAALLAVVAEEGAVREDVAAEYAEAIEWAEPGWVDWSEVNHAIVARWSLSGLKWIKKRAWKLASGRFPR